MGRRLDLHQVLKSITGNVYFQPPANVQIEYPCIVYHRDAASTRFAGNAPYHYEQRYQVTIISPEPDEELLDKVSRLPKCTYERYFAAENLNHDVFSLYF